MELEGTAQLGDDSLWVCHLSWLLSHHTVITGPCVSAAICFTFIHFILYVLFQWVTSAFTFGLALALLGCGILFLHRHLKLVLIFLAICNKNTEMKWPHESTWRSVYKAATSPSRSEKCRDFEEHWGILCLITILVKWCLTSLTMPSGARADTFSGGRMLLPSLKIKWLSCYLCS